MSFAPQALDTDTEPLDYVLAVQSLAAIGVTVLHSDALPPSQVAYFSGDTHTLHVREASRRKIWAVLDFYRHLTDPTHTSRSYAVGRRLHLVPTQRCN